MTSVLTGRHLDASVSRVVHLSPFLIAASLELAAIVSVGAISSLGGRAID